MKSNKRVVLVAGGSNGIGREIAQRFAQMGDNVVVWGRNPQHLAALNNTYDGHLTAEAVDISQADEVKQAVDRLIEKHHTIDVVVNAAGFVEPITTKMPYDQAVATWNKLVGTNLTGSFLVSQAVAPHLVRPGGRVIMIGSTAAFTGSARPGGIGYAAAKSGLNGLTFALAKELGPEGITVNEVVPGFIAGTGITESWTPESVQSFIDQTPIGRAGTPDDIAAAVVWLASREANFVSAQIIQINGGWVPGR